MNRALKRLIFLILIIGLVGGYSYYKFGGKEFVAQMETSKYKDFDRMIKNPTYDIPESLYDDITIRLVMVSNPFDLSFEDTGTTSYQEAMIARNYENIFLVDVSNIDPVPSGTILDIKGYINGSIYNEAEGDTVNYLDFVAKKSTVIKDFKSVESSPILTLEDGSTVEIQGIYSTGKEEYLKNVENESNISPFALYIKYTNNGEHNNSLTMNDLGSIYLGNYFLTHEAASKSDLIVAEDRSSFDFGATNSGESKNFYVYLTPAYIENPEDLDFDAKAYFIREDDNFDRILNYETDLEILEKGSTP